jgi:long-chain acyl-CoA synthetase
MASAANIAMLFTRLRERGNGVLLVTPHAEHSAEEVLEGSAQQANRLRKAGVSAGSLCAFEGDYGCETVSLFLAIAALGAVAVPFSRRTANEQEVLAAEAGVEFWIDPKAGQVRAAKKSPGQRHPLVEALVNSGHPGLVVFTSGSTGKPKAILHDMDRVASKFVQRRRGWRMVLFLLIDHFGGFNTLMSVLANDGVGLCPADRTARGVCEIIVKGKADLLPTTPTFLNTLIASGLWRSYDLSSLKLITYGAEPMSSATLARLHEILPDAELKQTYGLSELGVLRSVSPQQNSLWLRVGGDGFQTRVVDGELHIRSTSNMLGYLNAPTPIDSDGWMNTGDLVEEKDGLIRFLGRRNEMINVGGQKVMPSEIEDVLLEADGIAAAVVRATPHPLLGQAVVARVAPIMPEDVKALTDRLRAHCRARMQKYKVPMRFEIVPVEALSTQRAKKNRA